MSNPRSHPARLRLRVTAAAESALRSGHPWVYAESIREQNREGQTGELAVVFDRQDRFLAIGLFDPSSPLRVRVLHRGKPVPIDSTWWRTRLREAVGRRQGLFDEHTTGFRWIHGESDGWPGLVLDRYGQTLVLKLYTGAWLPFLEELAELIREELPSDRLVLRLSRNLQVPAGRHALRSDGQVIWGPAFPGPAPFLESGLHFEADVLRGQKTGFFLDQRENRRRVEALAAGKRMLNLFSFSGAFGVYAARGGAHSVTEVDISSHALEAGRRNFSLNLLDPKVSACRREAVRADVFEWLRRQAVPKFDLIVLDPPSLARREAERTGALSAYGQLTGDALGWLRPGGVLVAASCSAHVRATEFFETVRSVVTRSGRKPAELGTTFHPPDHPARFLEAEYLKCIYLQTAH